MPRQAPTVGARFNLSELRTQGTFYFRSSNASPITENDGLHSMQLWNINDADIPTSMFNSQFRLSPTREATMRDLREAGIWFTDIALICGFPSASSASAAYIRYCRTLGVEPQVRSENRRVNRLAEDIREASAEQRPDFLNRILGGVVNSTEDFGFGVEIEQVGLSRRTLVDITSALGLPTNEDLGYTHGLPHLWKAVPDGSLRGRTTGELVSRILRGHDGLVELRNVMLKLKQQGSKTNASCGQHIHIGIEPFGRDTRGMVIRNHATFQHVFDLLVNPLRRNHRDYARHTEWNEALSNAEYFQAGTPSYASMQKYRSLNINKYAEYGTFEFRAFHGCLNPRHSVAWLQLHFDFFTLCQTVSAHKRRGSMKQTLDLRDSAEIQDLRARMPLTMKYIEGFSDNTNREMTASPWLVATGCGISGFESSEYRWENRSEEWKLQHPLGRHSAFQKTVAHDDIEINLLGKWALEILREWVSDGSFVSNPTVRQVIKELAVKQFPMLNPNDLTERA